MRSIHKKNYFSSFGKPSGGREWRKRGGGRSPPLKPSEKFILKNVHSLSIESEGAGNLYWSIKSPELLYSIFSIYTYTACGLWRHLWDHVWCTVRKQIFAQNNNFKDKLLTITYNKLWQIWFRWKFLVRTLLFSH